LRCAPDARRRDLGGAAARAAALRRADEAGGRAGRGGRPVRRDRLRRVAALGAGGLGAGYLAAGRDVPDGVDWRHGWLPPDARTPQLPRPSGGPGWPARPRRDGGRGSADRLGRQPPETPRALRPRGRSPQPARRPRPRPPRLAVQPRPGRSGRLLPAPPEGRARPRDRPNVRPVDAARPGHPVRAGRLDGLAVGWARPRLLRPPRELERQLGLPRVRQPRLPDVRPEPEPVAGRPARARRGLAQQPPCLPPVGDPRPGARPGGCLGVGHRRARAAAAGHGRPPDPARAPRPPAPRRGGARLSGAGRGCSALVALLHARAQRAPDACAYTFLEDGEDEAGRLTYGELDRQARSIAAVLADMGACGQPVLVLCPPGLAYVAALFGCIYA